MQIVQWEIRNHGFCFEIGVLTVRSRQMELRIRNKRARYLTFDRGFCDRNTFEAYFNYRLTTCLTLHLLGCRTCCERSTKSETPWVFLFQNPVHAAQNQRREKCF